MLYDKMADFACGEGHHVLDIGCWAARHARVLARRFGCRVMAVDYFASHIERANRVIQENQLTDLVKTAQGDIHSLSFRDGEFDFVWCRDMLANVRDICRAVADAAAFSSPAARWSSILTWR